MAKEYPNVKVVLSNNDSDELEKTKEIASNCIIFNASFLNEHIKDVKTGPHGKYDLVLCYSVFHHLLKTQPIEELIKLVISHTGKYCVIEVPMIGDALLTKVMRGVIHPENFHCLKSPDVFRQCLVSNKLKVNRCVRLDYGTDSLVRYAYLCVV